MFDSRQLSLGIPYQLHSIFWMTVEILNLVFQKTRFIIFFFFIKFSTNLFKMGFLLLKLFMHVCNTFTLLTFSPWKIAWFNMMAKKTWVHPKQSIYTFLEFTLNLKLYSILLIVCTFMLFVGWLWSNWWGSMWEQGLNTNSPAV